MLRLSISSIAMALKLSVCAHFSAPCQLLLTLTILSAMLSARWLHELAILMVLVVHIDQLAAERKDDDDGMYEMWVGTEAFDIDSSKPEFAVWPVHVIWYPSSATLNVQSVERQTMRNGERGRQYPPKGYPRGLFRGISTAT